jgi:CO/xanthine dehydrogenase FAD-binding subunit
MISVRAGHLSSRYLVDVSRLEEMRSIGHADSRLRIGAAATFSEIINSPEVQRWAPALVKACRLIGSVQIRNVGTLGGNIANASPAADGVPPLVVHNGMAVVVSSSSERVISIEELITGPYRTSLKRGELISHILLDAVGDGYRNIFERVARRRALAIARTNLAAIGCVDTDGIVSDLRISVGSVTPAPCRMRNAEDLMRGNRPGMRLIQEAANKVSQEMIRQSGIRSTTEYKKPVVEGLVIKALTELFLE